MKGIRLGFIKVPTKQDKQKEAEEKKNAQFFDLWDPVCYLLFLLWNNVALLCMFSFVTNTCLQTIQSREKTEYNEFGEEVKKRNYIPRGRVQAPKMALPGTIAGC